MSSSPVAGPEMQQRYKFAQSVVALGPGTSASKTILLYEWLCAHLATRRSHGQIELFESQTHMWRSKSPQTCGARHVRQDMATLGRSIPPCGPASVQVVPCSCNPLPAKLAGFWKIPRVFDNGSAAPSTNMFFPCFNFLKRVLMFEFGNCFFLPAFSGLLYFFCCFCQLMINGWFGARWFGFLGSLYERDCFLGVSRFESQTNGPQTNN